jgi:hypothetical protein
MFHLSPNYTVFLGEKQLHWEKKGIVLSLLRTDKNYNRRSSADPRQPLSLQHIKAASASDAGS